jgi:hypothetical protein
VTDPTAPVTLPTAPVTEPTAPVTEPTAPVTEPTAPVTLAAAMAERDPGIGAFLDHDLDLALAEAEKADEMEADLAEKLGDKYAASEVSIEAASGVEFNDQPAARIAAIQEALNA